MILETNYLETSQKYYYSYYIYYRYKMAVRNSVVR